MTMTRRTLLALLSTAAAGLVVGHEASAQQTLDMFGDFVEGLEGVDAFLSNFVRKNRLRGAAVVIVRNEELVYSRSAGFALSNEDRPLKTDTLVPIGSVTKFLTALGTMKLVQDGLLELDTPFLGYLPDRIVGGVAIADERWKDVTIRQLLQMSAGISQELAQIWKFRDRLKSSRREFYKLIFSRNLAYDPGHAQEYNNCDFSILGDIIEAISGRKWRAFVFEEILQPVGIEKLPAYEDIGYKEASPNDWDSGAAGVACLSLLDLAKIVREFNSVESKIPLALATRLMMVAPPPPPLKRNADGSVQMGFYGLGLMSVGFDKQGIAFSHGGSLDNAHTFFVRRSDGTILVGYYCGEIAGDTNGNGQWTMCQEAWQVLDKIKAWPAGVNF